MAIFGHRTEKGHVNTQKNQRAWVQPESVHPFCIGIRSALGFYGVYLTNIIQNTERSQSMYRLGHISIQTHSHGLVWEVVHGSIPYRAVNGPHELLEVGHPKTGLQEVDQAWDWTSVGIGPGFTGHPSSHSLPKRQ